jgi:hypothetical protein
MEIKIKEVQDYFKAKMLAGEFEMLDVETYQCSIRIDGKYDFFIWTANLQIPKTVKPYKGYTDHINFIDLPFAENESIEFCRVLEPIINSYQKASIEKEIAEKEAAVAKLKEEYATLY